jgi:hypothetical protein
MNVEKSLFDQVASFENLHLAFQECSRGKRGKSGYQKYLFPYGERLKTCEQELKRTKTYRWCGYREFYVHDPKKRLVMAAPFKDRIVHTAIHRIIEPLIDPLLGSRSFACSIGRGNRAAVLRLINQLQNMGPKRYCIKLDVKKYFQSISHRILFDKIMSPLPDDSLKTLLYDLIRSHEKYNDLNRGIPIGNLTSQIFANFYLSELDQAACHLLDLNYLNDDYEVDNAYIRYMDDLVILTRDKKKAFHVANELISIAHKKLELNIPEEKKVPLSSDPIPFLGFVLSHDTQRTLRRNERKFKKKVKRLKRRQAPLSYLAQVNLSYESWSDIAQLNNKKG